MYLVAMTFVHTLLEAFYAEYTGGIYCIVPGNTYTDDSRQGKQQCQMMQPIH